MRVAEAACGALVGDAAVRTEAGGRLGSALLTSVQAWLRQLVQSSPPSILKQPLVPLLLLLLLLRVLLPLLPAPLLAATARDAAVYPSPGPSRHLDQAKFRS